MAGSPEWIVDERTKIDAEDTIDRPDQSGILGFCGGCLALPLQRWQFWRGYTNISHQPLNGYWGFWLWPSVCCVATDG
jgi:hypothetical protein